MSAYTKLFSSILDSSVWMESDQTRLVWITLLAMADQHGELQASVPGLARRAGVSLDAATDAIGRLSSPDPHSRTPDHEGRRIARIDGGWEILNHAKYRRMASLDERKEKAAIRQARFRERQNGKKDEVTPSNASAGQSNDQNPDSNATVTHTPDKQKQKQKHIKPSVGDKSPEEASEKQPEETELELDVEVEEPKPKKRKPNELLDTLLSECGIENPTRSQFAMGNKFLAEIKAVDPKVTVQQIRFFCSQKRSEWRGLDFTPAAVAKHWKAPCSPGNGHSAVESTPDNPFPGSGPVTLSMIHAKFSDNHERYRWMMEMDDQGRFRNG